MGRKLPGALVLGLLFAAALLPAAAPAAPAARQVQTMRCMTNYARQRRGKPALTGLPSLDRAARGKSGDILRCDQFDHEACGREFTHWVEQVGYGGRCTALGENIAWG